MLAVFLGKAFGSIECGFVDTDGCMADVLGQSTDERRNVAARLEQPDSDGALVVGASDLEQLHGQVHWPAGFHHLVLAVSRMWGQAIFGDSRVG